MGKKITVQVLGGEPKTFDDINTVADAKAKMNVPGHTASINGDPAENDDELPDYAFVTLAPAVKGA